MKLLWLGRDFLLPFFAAIPGVEVVHVRTLDDKDLVLEHRDASFILALNDTNEEQNWKIGRASCRERV